MNFVVCHCAKKFVMPKEGGISRSWKKNGEEQEINIFLKNLLLNGEWLRQKC